MQIEAFTLEEIKEIIEMNDELSILVMFTNLVLKSTKDRTKSLQMKNIFYKSVKKDDIYWRVDVFKDFFAQKAALETQAYQQRVNGSNGLPQVQPLNIEYDKHFLQVKIAFYFFNENPSFFPPNFDSKDVHNLT